MGEVFIPGSDVDVFDTGVGKETESALGEAVEKRDVEDSPLEKVTSAFVVKPRDQDLSPNLTGQTVRRVFGHGIEFPIRYERSNQGWSLTTVHYRQLPLGCMSPTKSVISIYDSKPRPIRFNDALVCMMGFIGQPFRLFGTLLELVRLKVELIDGITYAQANSFGDRSELRGRSFVALRGRNELVCLIGAARVIARCRNPLPYGCKSNRSGNDEGYALPSSNSVERISLSLACTFGALFCFYSGFWFWVNFDGRIGLPLRIGRRNSLFLVEAWWSMGSS